MGILTGAGFLQNSMSGESSKKTPANSHGWLENHLFFVGYIHIPDCCFIVMVVFGFCRDQS